MIHCLYIHIPFCVRKCIYCDFLSIPFDEDLAVEYVTAVIKESSLRGSIAGELKTIYIGGGTPTILLHKELARLLKHLRKVFKISPDVEITIEANPGTIDRGKVVALKDTGVNRFSLGIQSFIDRELRLLGRIHSASGAIKAVEVLRKGGIKNLSIDLIYGIPWQTSRDWQYNISRAIELSPEHVSTYELTPERGTPLYEYLREGRLRKPEEDAIVEMYYHAIDTLTFAGYRHYEISNFSKYGFECRHNLNYWNRGEYAGIGASAHSFIGDRRIKNTGDIKKYLDALKAGALAVDESTEVSCEDALKENIFLGLRKTEGLNIREFREDLGVDLLRASEELIDEGLLISDGNYLRLTRKGIVVSNSVITQLFEALEV
ncbi:MAG: radical SAM family heme chaperone HemW [Thermodesulfovibrionales bacterium]